MKQTLIILAFIVLAGCRNNQNNQPSVYEYGDFNSSLRTYTIDSCEYLGHLEGSSHDVLTHKGNCKFCKERALLLDIGYVSDGEFRINTTGTPFK